MIKKQTNKYGPVENVLMYAGVTLVVLGIAIILMTMSKNFDYMGDVFMALYYYNTAMLLGGGFLIGLAASWKSGIGVKPQLFIASTYALLALGVYQLLDMLRFIVVNPVFHIQYPASRYISLGAPLAALGAVAVIALVTQRRARNVSVSAIAAVAGSFIIYQIYTNASTVYHVATNEAIVDTVTTPIWATVIGYASSPLLIAAIAFVVLRNVVSWKLRLFYASFIGFIAMYGTYILWEFRTDPTHEYTVVFSAVVSAIVLVYSAVLSWRIRAAATQA